MEAQTLELNWKNYLELQGIISTLTTDFQTEHGKRYEFPCTQKEIKDTARSIVNRLAAKAVEDFSPTASAKLIVDMSELNEKFNTNFFSYNSELEPKDFSPTAVWEYLRKTYATTADQNAYGKVAKTITDGFYLSFREQVKVIKGMTVLNKNVSVDSFTKKWDNINKLSYQTRDSVYELLFALASFCEWHEDIETAYALKQFAAGYTHSGNSDIIKSRAKFVLGSKIQVTTFATRFEFRLAAPTAAKLQEFMSTYGQQHLKAA